jgi:hypothetical protein
MRLAAAGAAAALLLAQATAFSPVTWTYGSRGHEPLRLARGAPRVVGLRCQLDKVEASAVQRMTKGYDKLCKNCPTRLQPRVDTLTEVWWVCSALLRALAVVRWQVGAQLEHVGAEGSC